MPRFRAANLLRAETAIETKDAGTLAFFEDISLSRMNSNRTYTADL